MSTLENRDLDKVLPFSSIFDRDVKEQRTWKYGDAESHSGAEGEHLVDFSNDEVNDSNLSTYMNPN